MRLVSYLQLEKKQKSFLQANTFCYALKKYCRISISPVYFVLLNGYNIQVMNAYMPVTNMDVLKRAAFVVAIMMSRTYAFLRSSYNYGRFCPSHLYICGDFVKTKVMNAYVRTPRFIMDAYGLRYVQPQLWMLISETLAMVCC